jgi:hypothetical protein
MISPEKGENLTTDYTDLHGKKRFEPTGADFGIKQSKRLASLKRSFSVGIALRNWNTVNRNAAPPQASGQGAGKRVACGG